MSTIGSKSYLASATEIKQFKDAKSDNFKDHNVNLSTGVRTADGLENLKKDLDGAIKNADKSDVKDVFLKLKDVDGNYVYLKVDVSSDEGKKLINDLKNKIDTEGKDFKFSSVDFGIQAPSSPTPALRYGIGNEKSDNIEKIKSEVGKLGEFRDNKDAEGIFNLIAADGVISGDELEATKSIGLKINETGGLSYDGISTQKTRNFTNSANLRSEIDSPAFKDVLANPTKEKMLNTSFGNNVLVSAGIKTDNDLASMTNAEKGSVAFNFGLLQVRQEYFANPPSDPIEKIIQNPDMTLMQKKTALGPNAHLLTPEKQMEITDKINEKSQVFYEALGGTGKMPEQYLAAIGNGNVTIGVANSGVLGGNGSFGVGYFMYDQANPQKNNNLRISFPEQGNLEVKLSTYGTEQSVSSQKNHLNMKVGDLEINGYVQGNKVNLTSPKQNSDPGYDKFLTDNQLTRTNENYTSYLKEKGVTMDERQNLTFDGSKFPDKPTLKINYTSAAADPSQHVSFNNTDETQLQIGTNSTIKNNDRVNTEGLFATSSFKANPQNIKNPQDLKDFHEFARDIPVSNNDMDAIKQGKPVDLTNYIKVQGLGNITDDDHKINAAGTTSEQKQAPQRASFGTSNYDQNNDITSVNITSTTTSNAAHSLIDSEVNVLGPDLKKIVTDRKVDGKDSNETLSALRSLSFTKELMIDKLVQSGVKRDDAIKMLSESTISVNIANGFEKEGRTMNSNDFTTYTVKFGDIPPR